MSRAMRAILAAAWIGTGAAAQDTGAPRPIDPADFDRLFAMIRPQPGEQRFWQVPWTLTVTEARVAAAREGKPIFVWAGAGGAPIGVC